MSQERSRPREIRATYRLQLHAGFDLNAAAEQAQYLAALGISHVYLSPILQAAPGSTHGYDVVNPHEVNAELGGEQAFEQLQRVLHDQHLGQVLDIVPNHMAIGGRENAWWWDVLENGPSSRYARYFDVDWDPPESRHRNVVLMPILGEHYGRVLTSGQIHLTRTEGTFSLHYSDHVLPVAPRSLDLILAPVAEATASDELAFLADAFAHLPRATAIDTVSVLRRHRDKEVLRGLLADLCSKNTRIADALDTQVTKISSDATLMDELLQRQNYRLTFWRAAERELDYRRFFDINSLVGIRTEQDQVFQDTHALVLGWLATGTLDGIRIDHIDGLLDPTAYLNRLREYAPDAWIVVEKILEHGERLPVSWPIAGTTGYDFLNLAAGLFVDSASEERMTAIYADFTQQPTNYAALVREKKLLVLRGTLASDINRLTALWLEICRHHLRYRDYTRYELEMVLREVIASFPVYRTYVQPGAESTREEDTRVVVEAIEATRQRRQDLDADLLSFLGDALLLRVRGTLETEFAMRFQQLTGPAMAKGVEDTAFYCFNRLVSLNEVGANPGRFGTPIEAFHSACASAQIHWPQTLLATSTHDTKRSEDVRARIHLLSEIPDRWEEVVRRWSRDNEPFRRGDMPDRNAEYLLYQTLVGAWPIETDRVTAYMEKAAREAKQHTSWTEQNAEYEQALRDFTTGILADDRFVADLEAFVAPLVTPGRVNSLAQTLLKLTAPGVPDLYQGTELWDLSLVDPDNRRPVDFVMRQNLLRELDAISVEEVWARQNEGLPKLWTIRHALMLRKRRPEIFGPGSNYQPLLAHGSRADHVVAFSRSGAAITAVPRLVLTLGGEWEDTTIEIPTGQWRNEMTGDMVAGGALQMSSLLRRFPVALLAREEGV